MRYCIQKGTKMEMGRQNKGYDSGQDYRVVRVVLTPDIRPGLDNRHS